MSLDRALDYVESNLGSPLTIGEIVRCVGFEGSVSSFVRQFENLSGRTPHRYILDRRLSVGKSLINANNASLTDIALSLGFSSLSHFSSAFRRRFGVPPSCQLNKSK
ncbi:helix-turn-helix transcriptional regulator [Paraburkholderia sp. MM5482-R1]|uniref:helix-turn-helix transcriptional regulator n=1 Tax=unclassified Paraburkholderia TaxID=2615204 RepID=UPI003D240BC9